MKVKIGRIFQGSSSALSQMWIFAVYELLRTWNGRIRKLIDMKANGGLTPFIRSFNGSSMNLAHRIRVRHAEQMQSDPDFEQKLLSEKALLQPVYEFIRDIRVTLAKHEVPGNDNKIAINPGYARINMYCGSMDFMAMNKQKMMYRVNRRNIADMLRGIDLKDSLKR